MNQEIFDFSVDVMRTLLWQYDDAERLQSLIQSKQAWYDENHTQFWQDFYDNVFNLDTANDFGLSVWAIILDLPLSFDAPPSDYTKIPWGFGALNYNFTHGNFKRLITANYALNTEQKRIALKLRYFQLITDCSIVDINKFLQYVFGFETTSTVIDPYWDNVALLCHFNGAENSTVFTDSGPINRTITTVGNAKVHNFATIFLGAINLTGGGCAKLNTFPAMAADYTYEARVYITSAPAFGQYSTFFGQWDNLRFLFGVNWTMNVVQFFNSGTVQQTTSTALSLNTWYHIAFVRSSGVCRVYINGVSSAGDLSYSGSAGNSSEAMYIGQCDNSGVHHLTGYVDEARVTAGVARYTANFTPPDYVFEHYRIVPSGEVIYIRDNHDMTGTYVFQTAPPSALQLLFQEFDVLPRPTGVSIDYIFGE